MKKLLLTLTVIFMMMSLVACKKQDAASKSVQDVVLEGIDTEFMKEVVETISSYGDNQYVGMRSSGSKAERETAEYLEGLMKEIGLVNVTVDTFTNDNWSFNKADLYYTDKNGVKQSMHLGGYQTEWLSDNEDFELVYAGRGTESDYEGLDVEGKVVLIDIDQYNDWWINIPAYQAYVKGAKGIIAYNIDGYDRFDETTIGSQDACGPEYAPALSCNQVQAEILKELLMENDNSINITLDVESIITKNGSSQNVWGEIEGESDEVIYLIAHYDGYYHSVYDDASGVANCLGIVKSMIESGYKPEKTIRVVFHGAEEWGKADSEYDWATGAYNQIVNVHPEWAQKGLALINIDGMYPLLDQKSYQVSTAYELQDFARSVVNEIFNDTEYEVTVDSPTSAWTEDFAYSQAGIPCIVAGSEGYEKDLYYQWGYHSTSDSFDLGYDWNMSLLTARCFALMLMELDELEVRPVDFAKFFSAMQEECEAEINIEETIALSEQLNDLIDELNKRSDYDASNINYDLNRLFKEIHGYFVRLDWADETVFSFVPAQNNISSLAQALKALEEGDGNLAYDEYLWQVDYNWYAYDFDEETFNYCADKVFYNAEGTWGEGLLDEPNENLFAAVKALGEKYDEEGADYSEESALVSKALENQKSIYEKRINEVDENLLKVNEGLNRIIETYSK